MTAHVSELVTLPKGFDFLGEVLRDPPPAKSNCARALTGEHCDGESHHPADVAQRSTLCPLRHYRRAIGLKVHAAELEKMRPALEKVGYNGDAETFDLGMTILRAVDVRRPVVGLTQAKRAAVEQCKAMPAEAGNFWLLGAHGTGKSMLLRGLYFAWLRRGIKALWITGADLCELGRLAAGETEERELSEVRLDQWCNARALFLDDVGDRRANVGDKPAGQGTGAAGMLTLLNRYTGPIAGTANWLQPELAKHQDVGHPVMSRMFAERTGKSAQVLDLVGADQRRGV